MQTKIETAMAEIKTYGHREVQLLIQKAAKQIELAAAEQAGGDALLDGDADDSVERAIRLHTELRQIDLAITSCRARRLAAVEARHRIDVEQLRQRATDARVESQGILAKCESHLAALRELEGVDFTAAGLAASARLTSMAQLLDAQASNLERHAPLNGHAHLDGTFTNDELALAVVSDSSIGPSASEVLAWIQTRDPAVRDNTAPRSVRISWSNGVIDQASYLGALPQPRPAAPVEEPVPSATSRLRTANQFFGHAAPPVLEENRG
jgi:vacuolar-type H+-ATPase subunit I/STV1